MQMGEMVGEEFEAQGLASFSFLPSFLLSFFCYKITLIFAHNNGEEKSGEN